MAHWVFLVAAVLLLAVASTEALGNCTNDPGKIMRRKNVEYEIKGLDASSYARKNGERMPGHFFRWTMNTLVERSKTMHVNASGISEGYRCNAPRFSAADYAAVFNEPYEFYVNPLGDRVYNQACNGYESSGWMSSVECGHIQGYLLAEDFDCFTTSQNDTLEGHHRERVTVHYSHHLYPSLTFIGSFELLDTDLNVTRVGLNNESFVVEYIKDVLKINYQIENYPWVDNSPIADFPNPSPVRMFNNATWISINWNMTIGANASSAFSVKHEVNSVLLDVFSELDNEESVHISLGVLKTYFLDSVYSLDPEPNVNNWTLGDVGANIFRWNFGLNICDRKAVHWNQMWYDPTLTALFSSPISQEPLTPQQQKKNRTAAIVLGVVFGTVGLAVAIIVVILVMSPKAREYFRPFSKERSNPLNPKENNGGWQRSSKPIDPQ